MPPLTPSLTPRPQARTLVRDAMHRWRWGLGAALLASAVACGGGDDAPTPTLAQQAPMADIGIDAAVMPESAAADPRLAQIREVSLAKSAALVAPIVRLGPLALPKQAEQGGPLQIGAGRDLAPTAKAQDMAGLWHWSTNAAGRQVASASFESAGAQGIRLGLQVTQLPPRSLLRVSGSGGGPAIEIESAEVLRTIQRNLNAGVPEEEARRYWLPLVEGAQASLQIELAPDARPAWLKVAVPQLSHVWALPERADELRKIGEAGSCTVDAMCSDELSAEKRAVARMALVDGSGSSYLCTGTLLVNTRRDWTPYLLANYVCVAKQAEASTLQTYWFYHSSSCNSSVLNPGMRRLYGGAELLHTNWSTGVALLRLLERPPAGAVYAGWSTASTLEKDDPVIGLQHPRGDLLKQSWGTVTDFIDCGSFPCKPVAPKDSEFLEVSWGDGSRGIADYSWGSPLFFKARLVGVRGSTGATCEKPTEPDYYRRFGKAYVSDLHKWLSPSKDPDPSALAPRVPVFRFYNATSGAHFYTHSVPERDLVISELSHEFQYEGPVFAAYAEPGPGLNPVYRFYNPTTGAHFYTISTAERDYVINELKDFQYEGPYWYARVTAPSGSDAYPMYRFLHRTRYTHFYTIDKGEYDYVNDQLSAEYGYEKIGYYAWPLPKK